MKQAIILTFVILASQTSGFAQGDRINAPLSFADSVRVVLENTRSLDATVVGAGFFSIWGQLGVDQQIVIKKHCNQMRKRKFTLKSHIINYFGAIVNAISIEKTDVPTMAGYLKVAGKLIENGTSAQAQNFFAASRSFFQHHAISYGKTFRLYAREDTYSFDYIEDIPSPSLDWNEPPPPETESTPYSDEPPMQTEFSEQSQQGTEFSDTPAEEPTLQADFLPSWMTPPPPPDTGGTRNKV